MLLCLLLIHLCINNTKYVPFLSWFQINMNSLECLKAKWSHSRVIVFEGARCLLRCLWCAEWLCKPFTALCSYYFATNAMVCNVELVTAYCRKSKCASAHFIEGVAWSYDIKRENSFPLNPFSF